MNETKRMSEVAKELNIPYNQLAYWVKSDFVPCLKTSAKSRPRFSTEHIDKIKEYIEYDKNNPKAEKARKTNLIKYGVENPFQNKEVKNKIRETMIERYGVDSPLKSKTIRNKVRQTCINKYGVDNPSKNGDIKEKFKKTCVEKFGVDNPQKNQKVKENTRKSFKSMVKIDANETYKMVNILREKEFWKKLKTQSLKEICEFYNLDYQSLTSALLKDEFKDKYYKNYSFPTQQKQKELFNWLRDEGANVIFNDRSIISPLELDIVDCDKKVAVEFNGSFWHSEAFLSHEEAKSKHIEKTKLCNKNGYRLIHVFEHTYLHREKQVKNYLKSAFGLNKNRVHARKCSISHDNSNKFFEDYHIQGSPLGTVKFFNLVFNGEIVGSISAGKHHEKDGDQNACILTRLAFKDNVTVQGGATRLFKHMSTWAEQEGYNRIISWSDNTISEGSVYPVLGFVLEEEYSPSYFYYDAQNKIYKTKQSQRKSNKGRAKGVTIVEWNNSRGIYAIWDCGKKKWVYDLKEVVFCEDEEIIKNCDLVKENLSFDLVKKKYKGKTPIHGSCYVATEALYHSLKDKYNLKIKRYKLDNGIVHWWLETEDGEVIDATKEQFDFVVPYFLGKTGAFLTKEPSKRCMTLLERIK